MGKSVWVAVASLSATLILATLVNHFLDKWQNADVIAITYGFSFVLAWLSFLTDRVIDSQHSATNTLGSIPKVIEEEIRRCSIRAPVLLSKQYEDVVQTIFTIEDPDMRGEIIKFTGETLDGIRNRNGFPLFKQFFTAYKEKAEGFYKASRSSIHMTCLYCPIEYFITLTKPATNSPEHLLLFNGMSSDTNKGGGSLVRYRVMCAGNTVFKHMDAYPNIFAVSFFWLLFHNINFTGLYWSYEESDDDIIIYDKKFMWRYVPKAHILYLKCAWDSVDSQQPLPEWHHWFENLTDHKQTFKEYVHGAMNKGSISNESWTKFSASLTSYLTAVSQKTLQSAALPGMSEYRDLAAYILAKLAESRASLEIRHWMKDHYSKLAESSRKNLTAFFTDFREQPFVAHVKELYPDELGKCEQEIQVRE